MNHRKARNAVATLLVAGLLLALGPASALAQCGEWQWQNPWPTPYKLWGVWGSDGSDVFAVGYVGTIMHYNGTTWSTMSSATTSYLSGVWGSSDSDVFAVGTYGAIVHYDGAAWSAMDSGTTEGLSGVWGSSGGDVFAVGGPGTILHYDGTIWSTMDSGTTDYLSGVWGSSGGDVFAVGYDGTILHYDGATWSPMDSGTTDYLASVWGSASTDVFAVGGDGTIVHYDGTAWSPMDSGTTATLRSVWGSSGSDVFAVGQGGTILHYNGMAWSPMSSGTTDYLYGVWGSSGGDVLAVGGPWGGPATILHYDGAAWSAINSNVTDAGLYDVWGSDGSDVFAVAWDGTILHYDGTAWSPMSSGTAEWLRGVWGSSGSDVFAVGGSGTILHYDGAAWSAMSSGTTEGLWSVWGSSGSDVFAVGYGGTIVHYDGTDWSAMDSGTTEYLAGVWGNSGSDVFAVGYPGTILHYDGTDWSAMIGGTDDALWDMWGSSGSDVFAVGHDGEILHYDGTDWSPMDSGTTGSLWGVWGSSGSDVFAVGGSDAGIILHYDGAAWGAMSSGTYGGRRGVWGSSVSDVFAVGITGTILYYGFPDLALAKAVLPGTTVLAGELITFTLDFSYGGTVTATGVIITDVVPAEVTGVSFDSSYPVTPTGTVSYTWLLSDLPPGEWGVITVTGVVSPGLPPGHAFTNTATITSTTMECYLANNRDAVRVSILQAAPIAADDGYTTTEDIPLAVATPGVLANDSDPDGDPLAAVLDSPPLSGTLFFSPDGSFTYTPTLNFYGVDVFTYHATDAISDSNPAMVTLTVNAVNDPPLAVDDGYTTTEDVALIIAAPGVLANDGDVDGDALAAVLDTWPMSGTLVLSADGSFTYTPTLDFTGVDTFTYHATDTISDSNLAAVTLTVTAVNDPPLAMDDGYTTTEGTPLIVAAPGVLANDGDVDGDALATVLDSPPLSGTLVLNSNGAFTYTPALDFQGIDGFTYHATDAISDSNVATVTLTVQARPAYFVYLPLVLKTR
jgi:uncharacterized repeat protein (TIGR01451 family)